MGLSHTDEAGRARMVDVGPKRPTDREATAEGVISLTEAAFAAVRDNIAAKGDVLAAARLAGIMAAKKTPDLIPLCHPLPLSYAGVDFDLDETRLAVTARATVKTTAVTGVEMEALTAVGVALLTIYDMLKGVDKGLTISGLRLIAKSGGKSGTYRAG